MKKTLSLCPICGMTIPAIIHITNEVVMVKSCPDHGDFISIVEKDPRWWSLCHDIDCKNIYDGYMIDITNKCNLDCKFCYHDNTGEHKPVTSIISEATKYKYLGPTILTGGEPTLHPELPQIIEQLAPMGETWILTNGVKLADEDYFNSLCKAGLLYDDMVLAGLSFHKESKGKDIEVLELCRKKGYQIGTTFFVIDSIDQMQEAIDLAREYQDVIYRFRIKAASNLWNENKASNHIFISDMIAWLNDHGKTSLIECENNKNSYANVMFDGIRLVLVSWYDKGNVDLEDIDCGPWYMANDGTINNLVTTCLKNGIHQ